MTLLDRAKQRTLRSLFVEIAIIVVGVLVALGAGFFMLSDSLLATNRFVLPLPMAQVWVLSTYYAAQALIVGGWLAHQAASPAIAAQALI